MRVLLISTFLCFTALLSGQSDSTFTGNLFGGRLFTKYEVSLSFVPRFEQALALPGAFIEVNPDNISVFQQPFLDTINVFGEDRVFQRAHPVAYHISPTDASFWFGTQFRVHRRLRKGFELSLGVHYDRIRYTTRSQGSVLPGIINSTGTQLLYPVASTIERNVGLVAHCDYHLKRENKFHPFFGVGFSAIAQRRDRTLLGTIYTGDDSRLLDPPTDLMEEQNTILNIEFLATAGLLYRVSSYWQVGLTANTYLGGAGIFGAQVRYRL